MIKQGNVTSKLFPDEDLVISPHRNDEVGGLDQLLGKVVVEHVSLDQLPFRVIESDPAMYRLGLDVDPGRADDAGCIPHHSLILSAYSAVTLRKMFPVHTNRTD